MKFEDKCIIDYLTQGTSQLKTNKLSVYSYISNPDQTIRWIYPSKLKKPVFLNFYNSTSLRSKIFVAVVRVLFMLRLSNIIRTSEAILSIENDSLLQTIINKYPGFSHSIFTGTIGKNRKVIMELNNSYKSLVFVKIAISDASRSLIQNEFKVLSKLKNEKLPSVYIPRVLNYDENGILEISNIRPKKYKQPSKLHDAHISALTDINNVNHIHMKWLNMSEKNEIETLIHNIAIKEIVDNGLGKQRVDDFLESISLMCEIIDDKIIFPCGLSHGDFTPWNMYIKNKTLYIYDWELSKETLPILFDVFHYIFQSEILINHSSYQALKSEVYRVLDLSSTKKLIKKYDVNVNMSYAFYLIYISSYYINLYTDQKQLHKQVYWLIDIWENAADDLLKNKGVLFH